jgi:uncharacterized protein YbjT (DUF2867 family)
VSDRILVAGGTGRLGTLLVSRLAAGGHDVRVLTRSRARAAHLESCVEIVEGDVRISGDVERATRGAAVVVSAVHGFMGPRGVSPASIDRDGNRQLVEAAARAGAAVILLSVVGASSDSSLDLFRMKHAAEQHLRSSGAAWTIVRSTAFLETWIDIILGTADRSGRVVVFGKGQNPISFVSVADVAALTERAIADSSARGEILEVGGPEPVTLTDLATAIQPAGRLVAPRHVPRAALRAMSLLLRQVWPERARQGAAALALDTRDQRFDPAAIRSRYPDLSLTPPSKVLARRVPVGAPLGTMR